MKKQVPEWLTDHFQASVDAHDKLLQITRLSQQGIRMHLAMPNAVRALANLRQGTMGEEDEQKIEKAEQDAELAKLEIDQDFPVLHGLVAVAIWSWAEEFVKGFIALWLLKRPSSRKAKEIQALKIRIGDYISLSKREQALFLVDVLDRETSGPLKSGVNRFTSLLDIIGVVPCVSEDAKRDMFELQKIRNNLAHRNGRADRRLITDCPWLGYKLGDEVRVSFAMLRSYSEATGQLLLKVIYTVGDMYKIDARPRIESD